MPDEFKIVPYTPASEAAWESLIHTAPNGTLFHTRRFLGYHPPERFLDRSLLFYRSDMLVAVFPAAEVCDPEGARILKSHPGASYGGLVARDEPSLGECVSLLESLSAHARNAGYERIEFRDSERIFHRRPGEQMEFALGLTGYRREYEEISTFFELDAFRDRTEEEIIMMIPQKTRPPIRKGMANGLAFRQLTKDELPSLHAILCQNLARHGATPTHSLSELTLLAELFPDQVRGFGVFEGTRMVCGLVILEINEGRLHVFYSAMDYEAARNNPLHFAIFKALCWARERGYRYLNYGISTEDRGRVINWGLLKFKESFGGLGAIRTTWAKAVS